MLTVGSIFLAVCFLSSTTIAHAACKVPVIQSIDDVPSYCTILAGKLEQMPVNDCNHVRYLYVGNTSDYNVLVSLNNSARRLRSDVWPIKASDFAYLEGCLLVITLADDNGVRCSLQELKQTYGDVVSCLKRGWMEVSLSDCLDMSITMEKGWRLFMKKRQFVEEHKLIGCLISKFGLDGCARCTDYLLKDDGGRYDLTDVLYLLVKADRFDEFKKVFGF